MSNQTPYWWRSEGGYLPPTSAPIPFYPPPAYPYYGPPPFMPPPPEAPAATHPGLNYHNGRRSGVSYLYPGKLTNIHVINDLPVWDGSVYGVPAHGIFNIETTAPIRELINRLGGDDTMALTEVLERGDGRWDKGASFKHADAKADVSLATVGWTEKRRDGQEPVWVVLHKASC